MPISNENLFLFQIALQEAVLFHRRLSEIRDKSPVPAFGWPATLAQAQAIINSLSAHLKTNL